jgi:hypothetical protein
MVRARIGGVALVGMAVHLGEQTPHMLAQSVIKPQERGSLRPAYLLGLLEQIRDTTVVEAVLKPRRCREEAGEVGFISALQHTAAEVGQTFVVQDDETCQVMLEVVKLTPILKEITKDIRVGGHDRSRSHDRKLHETVALSHREWERG